MFIDYQHQRGSVGSLTILDDSIYVKNRQGFKEVALTTSGRVQIISSGLDYISLVPSITTYKKGIAIPRHRGSSHPMLNQKSRESKGVCRDWFTGHRAGLARRAQFYQLAAQCVEFDHVVYVCPI